MSLRSYLSRFGEMKSRGRERLSIAGSRRLAVWRFLVAGAVVFVCGRIAMAPRAYAIPAFARKYETSCATCHNNFPELNDFGEAFKKNGFKFPKDDESLLKQPPVLLGAPAQRQVFPRTVYPGEIPGSLPIGFRFNGFAAYNSKQPSDAGFVPRSDLFSPDTFTLLAAGSMGRSLSFWIDDDIAVGGQGADGGLGDGYLKVNDVGRSLGLPKDTLNVRFGQFEVDLPFSDARSINPTGYDIYDQAGVAGSLGSTNNPFIFAEPQRGIEIGGYPNDGGFSWSIAALNGSNADPAFRNTGRRGRGKGNRTGGGCPGPAPGARALRSSEAAAQNAPPWQGRWQSSRP